MKKDITSQYVLDIFFHTIDTKFSDYCKIHNIEGNRDHFITYLYDEQLISSSVIRQYTILATFEELIKENGGRKTETVNLLAQRFKLTPRSIWNVLRKWKNT
ncbi:MAG: hypothetical protein AAFO82_06015 [Bacteroidota bacterium]